MSMMSCPECSTEVSDQAMACTKCGVQLRKPTRSFMGKIFKFLFIAFNVIMALWLFSYFGEIGDSYTGSASDAEAAGTAIGGTIGTGILVTFWAFGDLILGLFVLLTRPK